MATTLARKITDGKDALSHHHVAYSRKQGRLILSRMIVKARLNSVVWFVFNVTFISFFQSILLYLFSCVPAYVILLSSQFEPKIQAIDLAFFGAEILLVLSEWISDGQQWGMLISSLIQKPFSPPSLTHTSLPGCQIQIQGHWKAYQWIHAS